MTRLCQNHGCKVEFLKLWKQVANDRQSWHATEAREKFSSWLEKRPHVKGKSKLYNNFTTWLYLQH